MMLGAHWLRLFPESFDIARALAWISGETRSISLPEAAFNGFAICGHTICYIMIDSCMEIGLEFFHGFSMESNTIGDFCNCSHKNVISLIEFDFGPYTPYRSLRSSWRYLQLSEPFA